MSAGSVLRHIHWFHWSEEKATSAPAVRNPVSTAVARYFTYRRMKWHELVMGISLAAASLSIWLLVLEKLR